MMFIIILSHHLCINKFVTVQNNPSESRQLLLQNPQLAYALLQVMIVMKIVDSSTALVRTISMKLVEYSIWNLT